MPSVRAHQPSAPGTRQCIAWIWTLGIWLSGTSRYVDLSRDHGVPERRDLLNRQRGDPLDRKNFQLEKIFVGKMVFGRFGEVEIFGSEKISESEIFSSRKFFEVRKIFVGKMVFE